MGEVVLFVDDLMKSNSGFSHCRICHEEEFESCKSLEAPCGCSGTVKVIIIIIINNNNNNSSYYGLLDFNS